MNLLKKRSLLIAVCLLLSFAFTNTTFAKELEEAWVKVKDLRVGDLLKTENGWTEIKSIEYIPEPITVYNMSVSKPNTFWANGLLAHNKGDERIVGRVFDSASGSYLTGLSIAGDGKTASWGVDGDPTVYQIGRWVEYTNVGVITLDPGSGKVCISWIFDNDPSTPATATLTGSDCTAENLPIIQGPLSDDWQHHLTFRIGNPPPPTCNISLSSSTIVEGNSVTVTNTGNAYRSGSTTIRAYIRREDETVISPVPAGLGAPTALNFYPITGAYCNSVDGASCSSSAVINNLPAGNYYVHCDEPFDPLKCSGNAWCDYEGESPPVSSPFACVGWSSCSNSDNAYLQVFPPGSYPECEISIPDITLCGIGDTASINVNEINETGGNIASVTFSSLSGYIGFDPVTDNFDDGYSTDITLDSYGSNTTYTAKASMDDDPTNPTECSATGNITITPPSCTITIPDLTFSGLNDVQTADATVIPVCGDVSWVGFAIDPLDLDIPNLLQINSMNPDADGTDGFSVDLESVNIGDGETDYQAFTTMDDGITTCSATAIATIIPVCEIADVGDTILSGAGATADTPPLTIIPAGDEYSVLFSILDTPDPAVAHIVDPLSNPDSIAPYNIGVESDSIGESTYNAIATSITTGAVCSLDVDLDGTPRSLPSIIVNPPGPWYQVVGGDIIVGATDATEADIGVTLPSLTPIVVRLIEDGASGFPGIPIAADDVDIGTAIDTEISSKGWVVEGAPYAGDLPSYEKFRKKIKSGAEPITDNVTDANLLGVATTNGDYYYFEYDYDGTFSDTLTLSDDGTDGEINIGSRKIVIFTDVNVKIDDPIKLDKGQGFLMIIAGGDISIDPSVKDSSSDSPDITPELEGVFYTDGSFNTGTSTNDTPPVYDNQLRIRGIVVADSVALEREPAYQDVPGEVFEYAPDQNMLIPPELSDRSISWKEVLP